MATQTRPAVETVPFKEQYREEPLRVEQVDDNVPRSYNLEHAETYAGEDPNKKKSRLVAKGREWLRRHSHSSEESEPRSRRRSFGGFHMKKLSPNEPAPDISDQEKQEVAEVGSQKVHERAHWEGENEISGETDSKNGLDFDDRRIQGKRDDEDHSIRPPHPLTSGIASSASVKHAEGVLPDTRHLQVEMQKLEADFERDVHTGNVPKSVKTSGNENEASEQVVTLDNRRKDPLELNNAGDEKQVSVEFDNPEDENHNHGTTINDENKAIQDEARENNANSDMAYEKQKEHIHREIGGMRAQKMKELDLLQDEKIATERELGLIKMDDVFPTDQKETLEELDAHNYAFYMQHTAGQHIIGLSPAQHNANLVEQQKLEAERVETSHKEHELLKKDVMDLGERKAYLEQSIITKKKELQQVEEDAHNRQLHFQQQMKHEHERERKKMSLNKRILDETFSAIEANKVEMVERREREVSDKEERIHHHHLVKEEQDEETRNALKREKLEGLKLTEKELAQRNENAALEKAYRSRLLNEANYHKRRMSQDVQKSSETSYKRETTSKKSSADEHWNELKRQAERERLEDTMVANQLKLESMRAQQLQNAYMIGEAENRLARKLIHETNSDPGTVSLSNQSLAATAAAAAIQIQKDRSGPFSEIERINLQRATSKPHRRFVFHKHPPAKSSKDEESKNKEFKNDEFKNEESKVEESRIEGSEQLEKPHEEIRSLP